MPKRRSHMENDEVSPAQIVSFVIRIWREEINPEKNQTIWRGHIIAIPNGKRRYFSDIDDIPAYITAHLEEQG